MYTQSQKNRNSFEVAFILEKIVYQWIWGYTYDPMSHDPDPGPPEKSTKKSCISFETECMLTWLR